jgi:DNA-binding beta-propeller fold protein YncE
MAIYYGQERIKRACVTLVALLLTGAATAAETLTWVKRPELHFIEKTKKWEVTFELDALCDVEVAIVDPENLSIIRHLGAGVLGPKAPPPFAANSRSQKIEWDGRDDYRNLGPRPETLAVRVRAGMKVALEQIVGGDPYAYFSEESGHNDHSPFGINGLEAKPDGKVYVLGHSSNLGPPALRQYDIDGNYLRTVFPPPAGKEIEAMQGWGINIKSDGSYTPKFNRLTDPSLTTTILDTGNGGMANLLPTPHRNRLTMWHSSLSARGFEQLIINTDGTIPVGADERHPGPLVKTPPLGLGPVQPESHVSHSLLGPVFTGLSPDGKHVYLSGVYAATTQYGAIKEIQTDGFWRDGQVWKVDWETRTAKVFFSLEQGTIAATLKDRKSTLGGTHSYAALHGVAVDRDENVFLCDRLNKRVVILDKSGKLIREVPVEHPDAIALSARTRALYVTTRFGDEQSGRGKVSLLKFNNWRRDDKPSVSLQVSATGYTDHHKRSHLVVCDSATGSNVWVAYTEMPLRIYRDDGQELTLLKDFYRVTGAQRCLGFDRMEVDQRNEEVYVLDDHTSVWKIANWKNPQFVKVPLKTASIAIDPRNRHIYARTLADESSSYSVGKVARYHLDQDDYPPANFGDSATNRLTPQMHYEWCFTGNGDKGIAIASNGNLAVVGDPKDGLRVFAGSPSKVPWEATTIAKLPHAAGGVRFDLAGNLYVGYIDKPPATILPGFADDQFARALGRIHKYAPTATSESGNLFPKVPAGPAITYDVPYGAFDTDCITRTPRFSVDGYGRIYYPTNIAQRVAVIDNTGNEILHFGTYGNRDSLGGLPGDLVPTKDVPLGFPNSVEATDNFIYVADMVNIRLLRLKKQFSLESTSR